MNPAWFWYRWRMNILEKQYLWTYEYDQNSRSTRLDNRIQEWIGKKQIQLDDHSEAERLRKVDDIINMVATGTQLRPAWEISDNEEDPKKPGKERSKRVNQRLKIQDSDSESEEGEPMEEVEEVDLSKTDGGMNAEQRKQEELQILIPLDAASKEQSRICWACGTEDSLDHLIWGCEELSMHQITEKIHKLSPEDLWIRRPQEHVLEHQARITDWWLHQERTNEQRDTLGQLVIDTFKKRAEWMTNSQIRIKDREQMVTYEQSLLQRGSQLGY
jgi:hypothetical protein